MVVTRAKVNAFGHPWNGAMATHDCCGRTAGNSDEAGSASVSPTPRRVGELFCLRGASDEAPSQSAVAAASLRRHVLTPDTCCSDVRASEAILSLACLKVKTNLEAQSGQCNAARRRCATQRTDSDLTVPDEMRCRRAARCC